MSSPVGFARGTRGRCAHRRHEAGAGNEKKGHASTAENMLHAMLVCKGRADRPVERPGTKEIKKKRSLMQRVRPDRLVAYRPVQPFLTR